MPTPPPCLARIDLGSLPGAELSAGTVTRLSPGTLEALGPAVPLRTFLDPAWPEAAVAAARAMAHEPAGDGMSLAARTTPGGAPFGWIQGSSFYNGVGRTMPWDQAWLLARALHRLLEVHQPVELHLCGGGRDHADLCRAIARSRGLRFRRSAPQRRPLKAELLSRFGERLKHGLRFVNAFLAGKGPRPEREVLFFGATLQRRGDGQWTHHNFETIQEELAGQGATFQSLFLWNRLHGRAFSRQAEASRYHSLESLFSWTDRLRLLAWALLPCRPRRIPEAPAALGALGLGPLYRKKLAHALAWRERETDLLVGAFRRVLKRCAPRLVVLIDEVDSQGLSLMLACRELGIPTVALQHGVIHPQHFGYVHDPRDHQGPRPFPLPDCTLVYGPYFSKVLQTRGHCPADRIRITGNGRYDSMRLVPEEAQFREAMGLSAQDRLIVLVTQPLPNPSERAAILEATCRAVAGVEHAVLLIKPHPREWDLSPYQQAIRAFGLTRARVLPGADLGRLFRHAELSISQSSTSLIESLLLGCPAITLNLTGWPELLPYAQSGACHGVTRAEDLEGAIRMMLEGAPAAKACRAAAPAFLSAMLGPMDGGATHRVVDVINEMLGHRR